MATLQEALAWLDAAVGKFWNPDNAHGYQCKDLPDAYCLYLWGNWVDTVRPGDGKDVFGNSNAEYFIKVANDPSNPAQLPPPGSILSFAGSAAVPEGHTAITESADAAGVNVFQMDGYRQVAAHRARLSYDGLIGWLIPKLAPDAQPNQLEDDDMTEAERQTLADTHRMTKELYDGFYYGGKSTPDGKPLIELWKEILRVSKETYTGIYYGGKSTPDGKSLIDFWKSIKDAVVGK